MGGVVGHAIHLAIVLVSSMVRRPTGCPCLSSETSSSPCSSSRKNSDEPSRARADGSAGSVPFGEDFGGSEGERDDHDVSRGSRCTLVDAQAITLLRYILNSLA